MCEGSQRAGHCDVNRNLSLLLANGRHVIYIFEPSYSPFVLSLVVRCYMNNDRSKIQERQIWRREL